MTVTPNSYDMLNPTAEFSAYWLNMHKQVIIDGVKNEYDDIFYLATLRKEAAKGDWRWLREAVAKVYYMRNFFSTSMWFFGLGPAAMQIGDLVCVILGADTSFVLR